MAYPNLSEMVAFPNSVYNQSLQTEQWPWQHTMIIKGSSKKLLSRDHYLHLCLQNMGMESLLIRWSLCNEGVHFFFQKPMKMFKICNILTSYFPGSASFLN